jgi:hypothetical protein
VPAGEGGRGGSGGRRAAKPAARGRRRAALRAGPRQLRSSQILLISPRTCASASWAWCRSSSCASWHHPADA